MTSSCIFRVICLLLLVDFSVQLCLNQLCYGNPNNAVRHCDSQGCGYFGTRRRTRSHVGIDIICSPGSSVYAPFPGRILRSSRPYRSNRNAYNNGLYVQGTGAYSAHRAKIFYLKPSKTRGSMPSGSKIGTSVALPYRGIKQHVHIQIYKNGKIVDPTPFIYCQGSK